MANLLNDSSTHVDLTASAFCARLTQACTEMHKRLTTSNRQTFDAWTAADRVDNPDPFRQNRNAPGQTFRYGAPPLRLPAALPAITFRVSPNKSSSSRTPAEQASEVAASKSNVCWGAHMSDKARHVLPIVDGKPIYEGDELERRFGEHLTWFKNLWASELKRSGLVNAAGSESWLERSRKSNFSDQLHVELPNAKIGQTDERAKACVDEYARLLQGPGARKNSSFEDALGTDLKSTLKHSLAKYEKAAGQ